MREYQRKNRKKLSDYNREYMRAWRKFKKYGHTKLKDHQKGS